MADDVLSIIVPVKDEAATLAHLITSVEEAEVPGMQKQILVVDDGSSDDTPRVTEAYRERTNFVVLRHDTNLGKGAAIRTPLAHVRGSIVLIQDADHEYEPSDHAALVEPIRAGRARAVYGSRFAGRIEGMALANLVANKVLAAVASWIGPSRITDEATCYKVFEADLLRSLPLRCRRFEFCPEVTGLLQAARVHIEEVPISYCGRGRQAGKKVRTKDGFIALFWLLWSRYRRRAEKRGAGPQSSGYQ